MSNLLEVKDRVLRYLTDFVGQVSVSPDGFFFFDFESTMVRVSVREHPESDFRFAVITAPLTINVPTTAELFKWVAINTGSFLFGHIECLVDGDDDKTAVLILSHTLLVDYLDAEELRHAVGAVANTANNLDNTLVEKFGGTTYEDL